MTNLNLPHRRKLLHLAAGAAALPGMSHVARAQAYPTRPVRIVVTAAAGGASDTLARLFGQYLSERLGQPFVIENRTGAAGNIGTEAVVRAPADGYTLHLTATSDAINATLYDKLSFSLLRDIAPVANLIRGPFVMVVKPSFPAKTVPEFIAYAKANPGKINFASGGTGLAAHVPGELFKMMTGVEMIQHFKHVRSNDRSAQFCGETGGAVAANPADQSRPGAAGSKPAAMTSVVAVVDG